jgi:hypothetical protein
MLAGPLAEDNKLTEKGALQLLFDLQFLSKLLHNNSGFDPLKAVINQVKSKVTNWCIIRSFGCVTIILIHTRQIDAINMRVFQSFITTNVERNYNKCAVMLGLLFSSSRRPTST